MDKPIQGAAQSFDDPYRHTGLLKKQFDFSEMAIRDANFDTKKYAEKQIREELSVAIFDAMSDGRLYTCRQFGLRSKPLPGPDGLPGKVRYEMAALIGLCRFEDSKLGEMVMPGEMPKIQPDGTYVHESVKSLKGLGLKVTYEYVFKHVRPMQDRDLDTATDVWERIE